MIELRLPHMIYPGLTVIIVLGLRATPHLCLCSLGCGLGRESASRTASKPGQSAHALRPDQVLAKAGGQRDQDADGYAVVTLPRRTGYPPAQRISCGKGFVRLTCMQPTSHPSEREPTTRITRVKSRWF